MKKFLVLAMFVNLEGRVSELIQLKVATRNLEPKVFGLNDEIDRALSATIVGNEVVTRLVLVQ